jgi:transmembrane sensor
MSAGSSMTDAMDRRSSIADEAAAWLATLTDAACTDDERADFVVWLRRSNLHVEEFLRISTLARRLAGADRLPRTDIADLLARAKAELSGAARVTSLAVRPRPEKRLPRPPWPWMLAAACGCATALLVLAVVRFGVADWRTATYSTSLGELRSITLEDGSIVELNTRSKLRARFTPAERRVELLSGEAVFRVAKNPARPFRVLTGSAQIVAVGTAFNVYAQSTRTVVTVLEGRVRVRGERDGPASATATPPPEQELELARGEQAIIAPHAAIAKAMLADPQQVTSWTERRLVFDETPLAEAAAEFARYDSQLVHIRDPRLAALHISGVFDATDPASLVQFVEAYGSVTVHEERGGWTLESKAEASPPAGETPGGAAH